MALIPEGLLTGAQAIVWEMGQLKSLEIVEATGEIQHTV
jgi:hypothetical protein